MFELKDYNDEYYVQEFCVDMAIYQVQCDRLFEQIGEEMDRINTPLTRKLKASIESISHNGFGSFEVILKKKSFVRSKFTRDEISRELTDLICGTEVAFAMHQVHEFDTAEFDSGLDAATIYIAELGQAAYEFDLDSLKEYLCPQVSVEDVEKAWVSWTLSH